MKSWWQNIWVKIIFFFSVVGPGIISANADNDAGGITTYSVVGAHYGTKMLWVLLLTTVALAVTSTRPRPSTSVTAPMQRPSTATALEQSSVVRIARSLFQRVLESDPAAARRLRDEFATRTSQIASDILMAGAKLSN